jgi:MoxR-like ATPase
MKKYFFVKVFKQFDGSWGLMDSNGNDVTSTYSWVRDIMMEKAYHNSQCLQLDIEAERAMRKDMALMDSDVDLNQPFQMNQKEEAKMADPVLNFIHNEAVGLRPSNMIMTDLKWKYLVRSAVRGKNIMMTGPAGTGKTLAAQTLVKALNKPYFYFNLGATQDPRGTLIGNTHFKKDSGTIFSESLFVKAIQTEGAIILLDELSRAHPEAWNILMTVLDPGQRYLRLDEHEDSITIPVANNITFIATANIGNEYTATRAMDRALVDRFVIIEMDVLNKLQEMELLQQLHPDLNKKMAESIAEIAALTRTEMNTDSPRISTAISTRISVEMAGLVADGFTLGEAAEVCIYPFFDKSGGLDSERTYIKQLVQKYDAEPIADPVTSTDSQEDSKNIPF